MDTDGSTLTMQLPPMAVLARKMANIMGGLKRLSQNGVNTQGWSFTSIDDITDAIRALMAEHGVALFSKMLKAVEVKDGKTTRATVDMEFELVCADTGVSKVMTWTGSAEDYSDKAVNKAAVYAEKFWLKSTFLVSTGKDPDSKSPGLDKRPADQRQQPPQQRRVDMRTGEVLSNGKSPEPEQPAAPEPEHWSHDGQKLHELAEASHKNGFIGHPGGAGIQDMLALIAPKKWTDFPNRSEAALAVQAAFKNLKALAAELTAEETRAKLNTPKGSSTRKLDIRDGKPGEAVIDAPETIALVTGGASVLSQFMSRDDVNAALADLEDERQPLLDGMPRIQD